MVASVHDSTAPEASTPKGYSPAEQFAPLAAKAVAVPALPEIEPVALPIFGVVSVGEVEKTTEPVPVSFDKADANPADVAVALAFVFI